MEHTRCTVQLILITSQKSFRTAFVKNCPQQHPIDFAIRWACKRNCENSHLTAYQRHCFANHRMMICILFTVVFFTVCTTIDREVRILERPLSRTIKNELQFFAFVRSFVPQAAPDQERMNARTEGFEVSLQLHRQEQNINAHIPPGTAFRRRCAGY